MVDLAFSLRSFQSGSLDFIKREIPIKKYKKGQVRWWNEELTAAKKKSVYWRRKVVRYKARHGTVTLDAWLQFAKQAIKDLRDKIRKAKKDD